MHIPSEFAHANERFFPTRWVLRGLPRRELIAAHVMQLRRINPNYGKEFRNHAIYLGVWPVSWTRADGTRHRSNVE